MIFLDTHVIVWLYAKRIDLIPDKIKNRIEKEDLFVSPIVALELEFLHEKEKLTTRSQKIINYLIKKIGLKVCEESLINIINKSVNENWTRDPFDRIIVGHAKVHGVILLTKDKTIRQNYSKAMWDD